MIFHTIVKKVPKSAVKNVGKKFQLSTSQNINMISSQLPNRLMTKDPLSGIHWNQRKTSSVVTQLPEWFGHHT
jgi:hypothetical protein